MVAAKTKTIDSTAPGATTYDCLGGVALPGTVKNAGRLPALRGVACRDIVEEPERQARTWRPLRRRHAEAKTRTRRWFAARARLAGGRPPQCWRTEIRPSPTGRGTATARANGDIDGDGKTDAASQRPYDCKKQRQQEPRANAARGAPDGDGENPEPHRAGGEPRPLRTANAEKIERKGDPLTKARAREISNFRFEISD